MNASFATLWKPGQENHDGEAMRFRLRQFFGSRSQGRGCCVTSQEPRAPDSLEPFLLPQKVSSSQDLEEGMGAGGNEG